MYDILLKGYFTNSGTKIPYELSYSPLWKTNGENLQNLRCNMLRECNLQLFLEKRKYNEI